MARPNYSFAKRQRELAKQQKKADKRLRKAGDEAGQAPHVPSLPASDKPADEPAAG